MLFVQDLQKLPWESMPSLRALPVTRLPSFHFLLSYAIIKEVKFKERGLGMMGHWRRPGEIGECLKNGAWSLLELGPSGQTGILITSVSSSVWGLVSAEPWRGSTQYLLRSEPSQ